MNNSNHDIQNAPEGIRQLRRSRRLTTDEVTVLTEIRKKVKKELPELIAKRDVSEEIRKLFGLETLATRGMDSLDFHDTAVWNIKKAIDMAFEAGRELEAKKKKPRPEKRFHLLHVHGSVDPSIMSKPHKNYESLLNAARKFYKSDSFNEGEDGLFYVVTAGNSVRVSPFTGSELEDED